MKEVSYGNCCSFLMNCPYHIHTCSVVGPFLSLSLSVEELELSCEELTGIRLVSLQRGGQGAGLRAGSSLGTKCFVCWLGTFVGEIGAGRETMHVTMQTKYFSQLECQGINCIFVFMGIWLFCGSVI